MDQVIKVCSVSQDVFANLEEFGRDDNKMKALFLRINKDVYPNGEGYPPDQNEHWEIVPDEDMEKYKRMGRNFKDTNIEEIDSVLSASKPRYLVIKHVQHENPGIQHLCLVSSKPNACEDFRKEMYDASVGSLADSLGIQRQMVFELTDREEFSEQWLQQKLHGM